MPGSRFTAQCEGQVAVWLTHGTADQTLPFCDGERSRDHWLADNGCGEQHLSEGDDGCVAYQGCDEGYPVIWCPTDLGHVPPSFAARAIQDFFARF